jgi:DNA-binding MarR family transcriptional regulator
MAGKGRFWRVFAMSRWPSQKQKTVRAFQAFLNVMDTADWLKNELRGPLESFDLTMPGFRVLEMLYREGALTVPDVARRRLCTRQNIYFVLGELEKRGWVRQMVVRVPAAAIKESRISKLRRGIQRDGPRVAVIGLTKNGKEFVGNVLPRNVKVVKALMRALDGREQESLSQMCEKLREGDVVKFLREMQMMDEEQEASELKDKVMAELERLASPRRMKLPKALMRALREASRNR